MTTTPAIVRASARPPAKYAPSADFRLWIQRFEIYLREADVPTDKKARELVSLLDDEPFRIISQLGLLTSDDYDSIKKELQQQFAPAGSELEWQYQLQSRRNPSGLRWRLAHARG